MPPANLVSNIQPDPIDFRDRIYSPTLKPLELAFNSTPFTDSIQAARVKDHKETSACTGFALSAMVEILLDKEKRLTSITATAELGRLSPYMLYYFARRYDEIPGDADTAGSTARGAMKAWQKHGACEVSVWEGITYPKERDWIEDAFSRPLGAYFRVDHTSLSDMHAAINETSVLYVTAAIHSGWRKPDKDGSILFSRTNRTLGGHAFLIVGYDEHGFWIQNSWGNNWSRQGFARLGYADWNQNGWDSWVGQAGVQTSFYLETISSGLSLKNLKGIGAAAKSNPVLYSNKLLSTNEAISAQQINPFVIDLENNGKLSQSGSFTTTEEDLELLVEHYIPSAVADFGLANNYPIDIAIYAHGGLTDEKSAANAARIWVSALYAKRVFPIFIMWETGVWDTLKDIIQDAQEGYAPAGALLDDIIEKMSNWADDRLEALVAKPGTLFWDEMKENSERATTDTEGGLRKLYKILSSGSQSSLLKRFRLHLLGHSAGSIFHAHLLPALVDAGLHVDGLYFMAPAARMDLFESNILPHYQNGKVPCYTQFHLDDQTEQDDNCIDIYHKSLLYLVSNAFERKGETPLLGMQKFLHDDFTSRKPNTKTAIWNWIASPSGQNSKRAFRSNSKTHGGFAIEPNTMSSTLDRITERKR